jgi:hypothetical protein
MNFPDEKRKNRRCELIVVSTGQLARVRAQFIQAKVVELEQAMGRRE